MRGGRVDHGIVSGEAADVARASLGFFASFFSPPFDHDEDRSCRRPPPDGTRRSRVRGIAASRPWLARRACAGTGFPRVHARACLPHAMFTLIILDQIKILQKGAGMSMRGSATRAKGGADMAYSDESGRSETDEIYSGEEGFVSSSSSDHAPLPP